MARIKVVTDASGNKFYPASITAGIVDIPRNQLLSVTLQYILTELSGKADISDINALIDSSIGFGFDDDTGDIYEQSLDSYVGAVHFGFDADLGDIYQTYDDGVEEEET